MSRKRSSSRSCSSPRPLGAAGPIFLLLAVGLAIAQPPVAGSAPPADSSKAPPTAVVPPAKPVVAADSIVPGRPKPIPRIWTAAVLPFTGSLPPAELAALSNRFESEMIAQDSFLILERRRMDLILKEQGFQQSGACAGADCEVEVGQLLGVQKVFIGEVSRVGGTTTLDVRRVDVATGRDEFGHSLDIRGSAEDVLRLGCHEMALIQSGAKVPDKERSVLVAERKTSVWPWVAGGALLAGGGATAALLLRGSSRSSSGPSETQVWVGW
jgi:hypothetical protein